MEDTKTFLNRIRREADAQVASAIKTQEEKTSQDTIQQLKDYISEQNKKTQEQAEKIANLALQQSKDEILEFERAKIREKFENEERMKNQSLILEAEKARSELERYQKSMEELRRRTHLEQQERDQQIQLQEQQIQNNRSFLSQEFDHYRNKLENDLKYQKKERKLLSNELDNAKLEIKSLNLELESIKKSFNSLAICGAGENS